MANFEVTIGGDASELNAEISAAESKLKRLSELKVQKVKLGLDTKELDADIKDAKANLKSLEQSLVQTSKSFSGTKKPMADAGNALTNFSRIAQDAPFGIIGIGNNITATAEAFSSLSKQSGGAGAALKAVGASLAGPGGILLAVSLVTTALTVMSQKGLTVGDVFNQLTGTFDQFKAGLQEINKEAIKNGQEQAASVGAYVAAAKNINLSMEDRLTAVKKLQDEYPGYFGNLTKEQILNGNVGSAVKEVTAALIARAKAQAFSEKIGTLASEALAMREQETILIEKQHDALRKFNDLWSKVLKNPENVGLANQMVNARTELNSLYNQLQKVQDPLRKNISEQKKWTAEIEKSTAASIKLDFKVETPKKLKKAKEVFETPQVDPIDLVVPVKSMIFEGFDINKALNAGVQHKTGIFSSLAQDLEADRGKFIERLQAQAAPLSQAITEFGSNINNLVSGSISGAFSGIGDAIGEALVNGGNVVQAVGSSLISSLGKFLSDMGGLLIQYGTLAVIKGKLDTAILAGGPVSIAAGLAAIGVGIALKAAGGAIGGMAQKGSSSGGGKKSVSAGNSVTSPTSSVNHTSSGGGFQNVVFEISGQSLIGVLSNAMNKNSKLGGTIAI